MGLSGLEPPTSRLSGARSNQLSYKPICLRCNSCLCPRSPFAFCDRKMVMGFGRGAQRALVVVGSDIPPACHSLPTCSNPSDIGISCPDLGGTFCPNGGDDGIRTHDPLLAGQVLSQLSYTPIGHGLCFFYIDPSKLNNNRSSSALSSSVSLFCSTRI